MSAICYREFPNTRRYGVELELSNDLSKEKLGDLIESYEINRIMRRCDVDLHRAVVTPGLEGWTQSHANNYWHVKFDRTCGPKGKHYDHGWEIASYVARGANDALHISELTPFLRANGVSTNINCGLHIHAETSDFSFGNINVLFARWLKIEDVLTGICHWTRCFNEHCMPLRDRYINASLENHGGLNIVSLFQHLKPKSFLIHNNPERRYTINPIGFYQAEAGCECPRNTIELRLPECRLEPSHVKNWIMIYVNFIQYCKDNAALPVNVDPVTNLGELLNFLGLSEVRGFTILGSHLLEAKLWLLKKIANSNNVGLMAQEAQNLLEFVTKI